MACKQIIELAARNYSTLEDVSYWRYVLNLNFPEFFLEPYMPSRPGQILHGCDLACGWGRIALALQDYSSRHIHCCDLTVKNLVLLKKLAANAGISEHISLNRCDITRLSYPDQFFDFFLAFDIFEHLNDEALTSCAHEILRCSRPGAVLYTETPMQAYCLQVTHVQNFTPEDFISFFENCQAYGKRFELAYFTRHIPNHFSFIVREVA
jgi:ubiquinone/menaquinone biosynthesis C-methylase UbiE